jgi:pyruvate/2-oxoglutarate dehydrogenase complex dihydrolipoamide acyltransferase (E2) component
MARPPDTREDLRRALLVNALTKPLNVLVPALVVVAASLLGASLLIAVALICWLGLAFVTFFDEDEAAHVGRRRRAGPRATRAPAAPVAAPRTPEIARRVRDAHAAADSVRVAVRESGLPLDDVTGEVDALVELIEANAARADRMHRFLAEHPLPAAAPAEQRRALGRLEARHLELLGEIDRAASALDTVHAEVLAADGLAEIDARQALAGRVSDLQTKVRIVSAGLDDAFEETRAGLSAGSAGRA